MSQIQRVRQDLKGGAEEVGWHLLRFGLPHWVTV